ncbi:TIGR01440 family protein [Bacillus norwichensis]|uniref:UPF0340 protein H9631_05120 n=1 Tax=Bacillus norwichensis TaxID=2762217 RepID=A0ABR8VI66_9BACI|nr:TIGR01440 family protein [Bacillus norwichensis]MBD8004455.1 TIGR01440 family protein [Bacillus norwichensis]
MAIEQWQEEVRTLLDECRENLPIGEGKVLVIGCSTSEIAGQKIGTSGTIEPATILYEELKKFADDKKIHLAFQCCEHLNRALVVERETASENGWEEVTVIPVRKAGGSMATCAYSQMKDPVVVEFIKADAGIDIGDTFIGMHLKHVAVPIRVNQKSIGDAHVTIATTRPKLIGGVRAVYEMQKLNDQCKS